MMRGLMVILYGLLMGAAILTSATANELLQIREDGWHTWQVDEPDVSSEMCCFTWQRGDAAHKGCNLDARRISFSSGADCDIAPGTIQVYVRMVDGEPRDIRVLSSNCPVTTAAEVADHGLVTSPENLNWFRSIIEDRKLSMDIREEALFGLVQSESDAAFNYLDTLLTQR